MTRLENHELNHGTQSGLRIDENSPGRNLENGRRTRRMERKMEQSQEPRTGRRESTDRDDVGLKEREKPLVKDLNQHIVCRLCQGYLIDATTLVECLHSFCRGCIIQRLSVGPKTCPVCNASAVAPLAPDISLQRLVYLVVPGLFRSEQERRRHFRQANPQCSNLNQPPLGAPDLGFDDLVSLSLCELDSANEGSTRYLKCPAGVTVRHLLRLLMLKRGWDDTDNEHHQRCNGKIEMMYEVGGTEAKTNCEPLDPFWTLMDLACIFEWKRESPMKLLYRISRVDESATNKTPNNQRIDNSSNNNESTSSSNNDTTDSSAVNTDNSNQAIENIQRPPTPPPSPKLAISRSDTLDKNARPPPSTTTATVVDQYSGLKDLETKKPRCEVTPVLRTPDPLPISESKPGKLPKLEHQRKRKKRRNKRVIAEITTTPREDLLKLKVRLTPCPPRVTPSTAVGSQSKEKLMQMRAVRKEKTKGSSSQKHRSGKERKSSPIIKEVKLAPDNEEPDTSLTLVQKEKVPPSPAPLIPEPALPVPETSTQDPEEPPKDEEVLRKLGLVAVSEANKNRRERAKSPAQSSADKADPAMEREKLEKQLRESKANRVRSLLAEKQMRDTLKSIMSNSKEVFASNPVVSGPSSSIPRSGTPTIGSIKRKEPPPLTPLRNTKRPNVTFAPNSFPPGKYESPLDLSSPSNSSKDNVLDLSYGVSQATVAKANTQDKPVGILRSSSTRLPLDKPREETKKTQDSNLRTLSDAAVSLLGDRSASHLDKLSKLPQTVGSGAPATPGAPVTPVASGAPAGSNIAGKVALRIPQPHHRITGFGMKIKPNIGVRHIPNPQAVVASQYRNQRNEYFNVTHQPP